MIHESTFEACRGVHRFDCRAAGLALGLEMPPGFRPKHLGDSRLTLVSKCDTLSIYYAERGAP